ncbi:hypothetical protein [Amphibacillus jilinensis]|uniref:hypothetical protein n=1 Tax=Amphibacillus jilinensis TaxID=1216008 RepID=UPI00031D6D40|nr:hypothetical protein [Amphibacillus jilinensis]
MKINKKRNFIFIFILLITFFIVYNHSGQSEEFLFEQHELALKLRLDIDYKVNHDSLLPILNATSYTDELLSRWKAIANFHPTFNYPKDAIKSADWDEVGKALDHDWEIYDEIADNMIAKAEDVPENFSLHGQHIYDYILTGVTNKLHFKQLLIALGIE